MTVHGRVRNGVVVMDDPKALPEGTEVSVHPLKAKRRGSKGKVQSPSLYERLKPVIGKAKGMPADAATNVDHYLYGAPKKK